MLNGLQRHQLGKSCRSISNGVLVALGLALCLSAFPAHAQFTPLTINGSATSASIAKGAEKKYSFSPVGAGIHYWVDLQPASADLDLYGHYDTSVGRAKTGGDGIVGHGNHRYSDRYKAQAIDEHLDFRGDGISTTYYLSVYGYEAGSYTIRVWSSDTIRVNVTYPDGPGIVWTPGQTQTISWSPTNYSGQDFHGYDVKLLKDGQETTLVAGLSGTTTSWNWTVSGTSSSNYQIKVVGFRLMAPPPVNNPQNQVRVEPRDDTSTNPFTIGSGSSTAASGRVVDQNNTGLSGLPIKFYLNGNYQSSPSATTDSSGSFSGTLTQSGTWSFAAIYQGTDKTGNSKYITVGSPPTATFDTLTIQTVANSTTIYGTVRDSKNGTPLSGSQVELRYQGSTVKGSATTDANGYYHIDGKADVTGQYDCKATYNGKVGNSSLFNVSSGSASVQADVGIDTTSQTYSISGAITNASNGAAISSALIQLSGTGLSASSDSSGYYTLGNVTGNQSYTLAVSKNGFTTNNVSTGTITGNLTKDVALQPDGQDTYDLVPQSVTPSKTSYSPGPPVESMDVSVSVSNAGVANVGAFVIAVYASTNANNSVVGDIPLGNISVASTGIKAGKTGLFSRSCSLSTLTQGQEYYIKASIDPAPRAYPADDASDNIEVSPGVITIELPQVSECFPGILKVSGKISGQCSDAIYTVAAGGRLNGFVYVPDTMAQVHTGASPYVSWTGRGFQMDPVVFPILKNLFRSPTALPMTVDALSGSINALDGTTANFGDKFFARVEDFHLKPYAQGGAVEARLKYALPLSEAARDYARLWGTDVFTPQRTGWTYIDSTNAFSPSLFSTDLELKNNSIIGSMKVSAGASIDFDKKEIVFRNGSLSFKILDIINIGAPVKLLEYKLVNYFLEDTIDVEETVPILLESVSQTKIDRLRAGYSGRIDPNKPLELRGGIGIAAGAYKVGWQGVNLSFTLLDFDADGRLIPSNLELHIGQNSDKLTARLCVLKTPMPEIKFDGFPLFDGEMNFYFRDMRADGKMAITVAVPSLPLFSFQGNGTYAIDVKKSYLSTTLTGDLVTPPVWDFIPFFGGKQVTLGGAIAKVVMDDKENSFRCFAYTEFFGKPGYGVTIPFDGTKPQGAVNLNKEMLGKGILGGKAGPSTISISRELSNGILRLVWTQGDLDASLTTPDAEVYDAARASITPLNHGPVFYSKKSGVEPNPNEEGPAVNEICFYIVPPDGADHVALGTYTLNVDDSHLVGGYDIQFWTPNTPPTIELTNVDAGNPAAVAIDWSANDPDDDADILLFYDTDQQGYDGQLITCFDNGQEAGPLPISEDTGVRPYVWNTTGLPTGRYYIYAMISDGKNLPVFSAYSADSVSVIHPSAPAPPAGFTARAESNGIHCTWDASATPDVFYTVMYDDKPMESTDRFENSIVAEGTTERIIASLTFGRTYRLAVNAFRPGTLEASTIVGPVSVPLFSTTANNAPKIVSTPITEGRVGIPYSYQVVATDADGDALTYQLTPKTVDGHPELASPPPGVTIDASTGLIAFTPVDGHLGTNKIIVQVSDAKGGTDSQEFYINIDNWLSSNSAPSFTSTPPTVAYVDEAFAYQAVADDPDKDQVIYSLQNAPAGMTIGTTSGLIAWRPAAADHGGYPNIVIQASDCKGGTTTQTLPLSVQYRALTSVFTVNPGTAQICPAEFVFTVHPNTPYVTNYAWDFGDGTVVSGPDKQTARHVFSDYAPGDFPGNKIHNVTLTVTGPGNPAQQVVVSAPVPVAIRAPQPTVDFTASSWSGTSPLEVTLTASAQWVNPEAAGGYAWDLDNDGQFDDATTATLTHQFTAAFAQKFPVGLKVTGPSGVKQVYKTIITQPATGATFNVINHPQGTEPYWPDWRKAVTGDIQGETLADPFNLSTSPTTLTLNTDQAGNAIAVSKVCQLNDKAFDLSFKADLSTPGESVHFPGETATFGGIEFVWCPPGTFMMGSPDTEQDRDADEGPQHQVTISHGFWMGKYEVTQKQWKDVMGSNPSYFQGGSYGNTDNRPVEQVPWNTITQTFLPTLNTATGLTFRLPTEAEREYACRAGTTTRFYWGDDPSYTQVGNYAWYLDNSSNQTHEVGGKTPNAWGLYDMSGNVWEWCQDFYGSYTSDAVTDPTGPATGPTHVDLGSAWTHTSIRCRSADRDHDAPSWLYYSSGLRLVLSSSQEDSISWMQTTSAAQWSARHSFASAAFNGKLWVLGGYTPGPTYNNDVYSSSDGITWQPVTTSTIWSQRVSSQCVVFNNELWMIGGLTYSGSANDVWHSSDGISWTSTPVTGPRWNARGEHAAVVFQNKMWVIGGSTSTGRVNDVWSSTDGASWTQVTATIPWTPRSLQTCVAFNSNLWLVGGITDSNTSLNDVWRSADGINWTQATSSAIWGSRCNHSSVVYRDKMWILGGQYYSGATRSYYNDVWSSVDGITWLQETAAAPWSMRHAHKSVVLNDKMWVMGGHNGGSGSGAFLNDVWSASRDSWAKVSESGPPIQAEDSMVFDSARKNCVLVENGTGATWTWDGLAWTQHAVPGPGSRGDYAMAFDSQRERVVYFGGYAGATDFHDTWEWDGTGWTHITDTGPPARCGHAMVYDSQRGKVVLFGGITQSHTLFNDTWEWDGSTWQQSAPPGPLPVTRYDHAMAYDSKRGKTVLFGGTTGSLIFYGDTWEWDGASWTQISSAGPCARSGMRMAYDEKREAILLYGGCSVSGSYVSTLYGDTWDWDGIQWRQIFATQAPSPRWRHMMAYDSWRQKTVLFGGSESGQTKGDTWTFGQDGSSVYEEGYMAFSPTDYLRVSVDANVVRLDRVSVVAGIPTVVASSSGSLSSVGTNPLLSIRYDGIGSFRVYEDGIATDVSITGTPGSSVVLGLGFKNDTSTMQTASFTIAQLSLRNDAPQITNPIPSKSMVSGTYDDSVDLDALTSDDLTPDANLSFTVSDGIHVDAQVDPATHHLILSAHPGVTGSPTDVLQIVVTDEGGLSAQSTISVTVTPEPVYLFTNIGTIAQVEEAGRSGLDASMGFLTGADGVNLFATKSGQTVLFANSGNNVYSSVAAPAALGNEPHTAIGDFNNDGKPDVFIVSDTGGKLYGCDGLGTFVDVTMAPLDAVTGKSCVWVDVDNDGDLDLYVVCNGANRLFLNGLIGSGTASFTEATNANGLNDAGNGAVAVFADVNGDGAVDCYVANLGGTNALYLNNGSGMFALASGSSTELTGDSHGAVFADFDNDGYPDLYVAKDGGDALLMNNGNGTFTNVTVAAGITNAAASRSVAALDYDNDGYLDIFVSNNGSPNVLYHNNGNGTFTNKTAQSGVAGPLDGAGMGAAVGDIDNDGDVDIWQVNTNGQPAALFRNNLIGPLDDPQLTPNHHWLGIRLTGAASGTSTAHSFTNPSAIGARVELWKNGRLWQTQTIDGGPNSPSLHFGLGADTVAEQIVVRWPSGNVSRTSMTPGNQIVTIAEERVLDGVFLSPGRLSLTVGQAQGCTATAHYANGVTELLNASDLFWSVEHEAVARVDAMGMVVGIQNGTTQVTARLNGVVSLPVDIEVADAPLASVVVTPVQARLVVGDSQPYAATAEYWDGTGLDVTSTATWHSDNPSVATISSAGIAMAHAAGTVHITAVFRDVTSNAVTLDVVSGVTTALELNARESRFYNEAAARTNPFVALKTFSDGSPAVDVSNQVQWIVDNVFVAWINADGKFVTTSPGQANVQASQGTLQTGTLPADVANHLSLTQSPAAEIKKYLGDIQTFQLVPSGGFAPLTYQWTKDGNPIGTSSSALVIPVANASDAGVYRATISDSFSESIESNTSTLRVAPHLSIAIPLPETVEKHYGQSVDFLVQMAGGFEPLTYQWYKDDGIKALIPVGTDAPLFGLQNLSASDAGTYQVQVIDSNTDSQMDSTTLTVTQGVPVAGLAGLSILFGALTIGASIRIRKK